MLSQSTFFAPSGLNTEFTNFDIPGGRRPVATDLNPPEGEFAEMLKKLTALPRYGTPDEIAAMVAYLTGPEAGFVTGASSTIDGGFAA
jgi:NAD(P)-dependent dehydrogenase (short-subunit alcohol dehydrogenase family)